VADSGERLEIMKISLRTTVVVATTAQFQCDTHKKTSARFN